MHSFKVIFHVLSFFAQFLNRPIFRGVHEFWRRLHLRLWPHVLQKRFGFQWIPRHSIQHQGDFHFLYSDIDLALILPWNASADKAEKAIRGYLQWKRIFIFLGELEVYFDYEWIEKEKLESQHPALLRLIRQYRKTKWLENDFQNYKDPYHKQKALRSLEKIKSEFPDFETSLQLLISQDARDFLTHIPQTSDVVPFYDRDLSGNLSLVSAQFLKALAPHFHFPQSLTSDLQSLRQVVLTWELLCYQAYLRMKDQKLFASNDWLSQIAFELKRKQVLTPEDQDMQIFNLSQIQNEDPAAFSLPFSVQLDLTRRMQDHLNETYSQQDLSETFKEEEILHRAAQIQSAHPFTSQWLKTNLPVLVHKLNEDFGKLKLISPRNPNKLQTPQEFTLSFFGPLAPQFGLHLLLDLLRQLEDQTQTNWTLELCGPEMPPYSEKAVFELLDYSSSNRFHIRRVETPSGLLLLPYRWNLPDEIHWIERAQSHPLPAVIGFDFQLAQRVTAAFESNEDQISAQFQDKAPSSLIRPVDFRLRTYAWEWNEKKAGQWPASMIDLNEYLKLSNGSLIESGNPGNHHVPTGG